MEKAFCVVVKGPEAERLTKLLKERTELWRQSETQEIKDGDFCDKMERLDSQISSLVELSSLAGNFQLTFEGA